ncbi:hypothetical protein [Sinanaerobacter sp. ZZT-01]|uniref:hypothetical protein n=1 Tax=Sinanaerobacter sp. ZZT-01 TaxID=3111540 RepID=UPI002D796C44|nr:hypothetical protein [Sinanaerobacter sp. ZZT-01]WRR92856.1 hypothetical protein U5921_12560 [Sinanaerobacter sp. ZZT-01]
MDELELEKERLHAIGESLHFSELQFQRIKSTINKTTIWSNEVEEAIVDFMQEFDDHEEMKEELEFRYEAARLAATSTKELRNQLNKCAERELPKEELLMILNGFLDYYKVVSNQFNNEEDTQALAHLRKILNEILEL